MDIKEPTLYKNKKFTFSTEDVIKYGGYRHFNNLARYYDIYFFNKAPHKSIYVPVYLRRHIEHEKRKKYISKETTINNKLQNNFYYCVIL